jgi:hypothetical protein
MSIKKSVTGFVLAAASLFSQDFVRVVNDSNACVLRQDNAGGYVTSVTFPKKDIIFKLPEGFVATRTDGINTVSTGPLSHPIGFATREVGVVEKYIPNRPNTYSMSMVPRGMINRQLRLACAAN